MKVVSLMGSPRKKSNSSKMALKFCALAKENGAEVLEYNLNSLSYKGCQGCYACKTTKNKCVVKDDLEKVLKDVFDCDILVLSTPVYYGDVTAQLKGFIDRTFSYLVPDYPTNKNKTRLKGDKKIIFFITQGHPNENLFSDVYPKYSQFFKWLGFAESHLVRKCGISIEDNVENDSGVMNKIDNLAKNIFLKS